MDNRGIDTDPGWVNRKLRELERMIEGLRSERRAASTSVDTGSFRVTAEGQEVFRIGDMEFGDRGLIIHREDGSIAFEVRKLLADGLVGQAIAVRDGSGISVLETDALFGGMRAPYLDHPFQPYSATTGTAPTCGPHGLERTSTSTTFETAFVYDGKRQNPFLHVRVAVRPSDTTTAGEVRVVDLATGTPLSLFLAGAWVGTIAAGAAAFTVAEATALVTASAAGQGQRIKLGVQVRRTAGTGTLTIAVPTSVGG